MNIFWGMKILWIFFWFITKLDYRGHFYAFQGLFLRSRYRMGDIFWVAKISFFLWGGCLKFLIFFGGKR